MWAAILQRLHAAFQSCPAQHLGNYKRRDLSATIVPWSHAVINIIALMGRTPCCDKSGLKKGPWTAEEDQKLIDYIQKHGHGSWRSLPENAGKITLAH